MPSTKKPDIDSIKKVKSFFYFRKISNDHAYQSLSKVLAGKKKASYIGDKPMTNASYDAILLHTCQIIGDIEKIHFVKGFSNASETWSPLKKILRASNIRAHKIVLEDGWWEQDQGPFLAFLKEDNTPVALIKKGKEYLAINVRDDNEFAVNAVNQQKIDRTVYSFFSPFPPGKLTSLDLLKFTLSFTKSDVTFFLIIGVIGALLALLIPIMTGYIFNVVVPGSRISDLFQIGALLVTIVVVIGFLNFTKEIAVLRFEGKSSFKLQSAVWDRLLSLKVPFFSKYDAGNLAERSMSIEKIRTILSANVMSAIIAAFFSISYLGLMLYYDWGLALLALLLGSTVAIFTLTISLLAYKHVAASMRMQAIISGFMMMIIGGMRKIRMTATGDKVFDIWADKFSELKQHYFKKQKLLIVAAIFTFGFPILASLLIYIRIFVLLRVPGSAFQIGDFIAFNSAYLSFQGALISMFMVTVPLMSIKPNLELLKPILESEPEEYDHKKDPGELTGDIEVHNLRFSYSDSPAVILKGISLKINSGEFVALVGGSGSGKSTFFRILLGFEEYNSGVVLFDGIDLKELDIRIVRDQLGVVLQGGKIMQGTVLYNIIGNSNFTEEDAWEAARMAGCDQDIDRLENKMHTQLPAGGGILSGGQKQRIVIARALIKKPKLLLFDEATSALDNDTQKTVTENIRELKATKVVIAHRLSTIKDADRIIVLDKGEIVEQGGYDELLKKKGWFYNLVQKQTA